MNFALQLAGNGLRAAQAGRHDGSSGRCLDRTAVAPELVGNALQGVPARIIETVLNTTSRHDPRDDREGDHARADARPHARLAGIPETLSGRFQNGRFQMKVHHDFTKSFVKNGAFALVSLGFAPSFLARTAFAAGAADASEAADRDLSAGRGRRPQHDRSIRRQGVLPRTAGHRDRSGPARGRATARSISTASSDSTPGCGRSSRSGTRGSWPSFTPAARPTTPARISTRRTTWRSATPGVKSTPDGWLNRYLQARRVEEADAVSRGRDDAAAAPRAPGHGARPWPSISSNSSGFAAARPARWSQRPSRVSSPRRPIVC